MFRRKPKSNDPVKAAFLAELRAANPNPEPADLNGEFDFSDFYFRALARKQDQPTQLVFVQWMVSRALGLSTRFSRRVPLDHGELRFPDSYVIEFYGLPNQGTHEYFTLCCPNPKVDRTLAMWQAWCPDNWLYYFFSRQELDAAGVFKSVSLKTFLKRETPMKSSEFRLVASAWLGLET